MGESFFIAGKSWVKFEIKLLYMGMGKLVIRLADKIHSPGDSKIFV